jgi:pyruvate,orthophosphate dikinase
LINAQGEDVVAGVRTPQKLDAREGGLQEFLPEAYAQLWKIQEVLEKHYRDMQDIEFTIEKGKLYILQTRHGKRTAAAALKIAVDMAEEGLISQKEALLRVKPQQLDQLLHPCLDPSSPKVVIATGLPASPGAVSGQVVFDSETAQTWVKQWKRAVILVRLETSPEDIQGMALARGVLTARGGMTSHAAVVARGMGLACISGCSQMKVRSKEFHTGTHLVREGDWITLDGSTGEVMLGQVPTLLPTLGEDFRKFMSWVDRTCSLEVRANADTGVDARIARNFGAQGVGLCRTEHMFFDVTRIDAVREMIVAETSEARRLALEKILPMQKSDFQSIFREMEGFPVTIRLLDPPLHEFLPQQLSEVELLASKLGISREELQRKIERLHEFNPMLGHRGCRLGVSYPEIYRTQVRAIFEAACELSQQGVRVQPEIMIPLVGDWRELKFVRDYCDQEASAVFQSYDCKIDYRIGTMIELPRAALTAGEIAEYADFFSFGTNDLTQTTWGLSRDDSGSFLNAYLEAGIYQEDPFASLDRFGVGRLMQIAMEEGRLKKPELKIGLCGEHGGEPASVEYCHDLHLDYVSCSPYRIPIAKLAASQAYLRAQK